MEIIIPWLFLSIIAAVIASNKGRSGIGFFLLAILLSPLVGIIAALIAGENKSKVEEKLIDSGENKKCPFCAEIIKTEAKVCKHCGRDQPAKESTMASNDADKHKIIDNGDGTYRVYGKNFNSRKEAVDYLAEVGEAMKDT